ncbi:short-chain dehydrogenase/reductase SDR [Thermincola ferriacetica]|uniref:Short-chain dehydrogenase/reductase SDR n=1 Tax=Thermincola ferriacetica TaxID=281456 RepID=A0A0L6W2X9_9FIRM|nr:glucose 1-dehydrogenase [Thermincola ferriacetica]KNZ69753.1 short-chain dehydrogenase/reductase SDR [Thermincola ferriacetica]
MSFTGKVVIVTGAGSGIGRAVARMYAEHNARVIIAERNPETGKETEQVIKKAGGQAIFYQTDVSRPDDILALMKFAEETYGRIEILINNAGVSRWKSPYEITVAEWDEIININLRGVFLCAREAAKVMRKHGGGAIVNIASTRAIMSEPDSEAYAASKGGIVALTHALAVSLGRDKIRVNAVSPGWIELGDYALLREIDHLQHPAGRVGKPEDIARACLFLTAEGNDFITGANLVIDGGMTRKMIYEP